MKKQIIKLFFAVGVAVTMGSCSDFQDINKDPNAVPEKEMRIDFMLNASIIGAQQDPDIAERMFILIWDRVARYEVGGGVSVFSNNDEWNSNYWGGGRINGWLKDVTLGIQIAEKGIAEGTIKDNERNLYQMCRIWRAYLFSEYSDNFGPVAITGKYDGVAVDMSSTEKVYEFILTELAEASAAINLEAPLTSDESKNDNVFAGDLTKWKKYANSMRLRCAIRVGNQAAFEAAAVDEGGLITAADEIFQVQEKGGWDPTTGVMTRSWDEQQLSLSFANLTIGLGGVTLNQIAAVPGTAVYKMPADVIAKYSKDPKTYMGLRMNNYLPTSTNVQNAGYMWDYMPSVIDPRTLVNFSVAGYNDGVVQWAPLPKNNKGITKLLLANGEKEGKPAPKAKADTVLFRSQYTFWGGYCGDGDNLASNFSDFSNQNYNLPLKSKKLRDNERKRVFFGPWETYFLLAEASLKGWATGTTDQAAYEAGIKASFDFQGVGALASSYISSQDYSLIGTSVDYNHTAEIASTTLQAVDFEANLVEKADNGGIKTYVLSETPTLENVTYTYPRGAYATNNDKLTKIITQKYIANCPWLPQEAWSDYRRLNLPFLENPAVEIPLVNMTWYTKANSGQFVFQNVPQRLTYPASLVTNNEKGYKSGLAALGGADNISTPLSWAKKQ